MCVVTVWPQPSTGVGCCRTARISADVFITEDGEPPARCGGLVVDWQRDDDDDLFFYKFCPNLLDEVIDEDRAPAKQSLLRWPCPLPSDRAIPVLWQNLESNV